MTSSELTRAWNARMAELQALRMQPYADLLYSRMADLIVEDREVIHQRLLERVSIAAYASDINTWLFNHNADVRVSGEWPETGNEVFWTVSVDSELPPESLYKVIRTTDVCHRLSLLLGGTHYWVYWAPSGVVLTQSDTDLKVPEYELMVRYYPNGLSQKFKRNLQECEERHRDRVSYEPTHRVVWSDIKVPTTPLRAIAALPPPPPLLRRSIPRDHEDDGETRRTLFKECAHQCYCGYDSE